MEEAALALAAVRGWTSAARGTCQMVLKYQDNGVPGATSTVRISSTRVLPAPAAGERLSSCASEDRDTPEKVILNCSERLRVIYAVLKRQLLPATTRKFRLVPDGGDNEVDFSFNDADYAFVNDDPDEDEVSCQTARLRLGRRSLTVLLKDPSRPGSEHIRHGTIRAVRDDDDDDDDGLERLARRLRDYVRGIPWTGSLAYPSTDHWSYDRQHEAQLYFKTPTKQDQIEPVSRLGYQLSYDAKLFSQAAAAQSPLAAESAPPAAPVERRSRSPRRRRLEDLAIRGEVLTRAEIDPVYDAGDEEGEKGETWRAYAPHTGPTNQGVAHAESAHAEALLNMRKLETAQPRRPLPPP
jgi:hypothetical protein